MKNCFTFILLTLFTLKIYSQEVTELDIHSTHLNEVKVVKIYIPEGYKKTKKKYPLTVILDSEILFDSYVATSKLFAKNKTIPQQIIVGVNQYLGEDKEKNYGYNFLNSFPHRNSINTLEFIKQELIPMMKRKYKIANFKTIIGTEMTGNFLNYFLFENDPEFDAYICINPEYATDMPELIKGYIPELKNDELFYYLSNGSKTLKKYKNLIDDTDAGLANTSNIYFNYKYDNFIDASTLVSIPQSIASAQEFIFSLYSKISDQEYKEDILFLSPLAAMEYLMYKYENIEYLFGEKLPIRQEDFVKIESIVLDTEEGKYLEDFSDLAFDVHPKKPLGDYYLGQFYEKQQMYSEALLSYKKGLEKIPKNSSESYSYYKNIKRIISIKKIEKEKLNNPNYYKDYVEEEPSKNLNDQEENLTKESTSSN